MHDHELTDARPAVDTRGAVRALPFVVPPAAGESWWSWVDANAAALAVPVSAWLAAVGVVDWSCTGRGGSCYGVTLSDTELRRVSATTGVSTTRIAATLLSRFDGGPISLTGLDAADPRSLRAVASREPATFKQSALLPAAFGLDDPRRDGVWQTRWQLRILAVDPTTGVVLSTTCPRCGLPHRTGRLGRQFPGAPHQVPVIGQCANLVLPAGEPVGSRRRELCGYPLAEVPVLDLDEGDPVWEAADAVSRLLDRFEDGDATGEVPAAVTLQAVTRLVSVAAYAVRSEDLSTNCGVIQAEFEQFEKQRDVGRPDGTPCWTPIPRQPVIVAAVLPFAVDAVCAPSGEWAPRMGELAEAVARRRRECRNAPEAERSGFGLPAPYADAWRDAMSGQRRGVARRIRWETSLSPWTLTVDEIPALVPADEYRALFAALMPGTAETTGRLYAALVVTRVVTGLNWAACGVVLGVDSRTAARCADVVSRRITTAKTERGVVAAGVHLAGRWDRATVDGSQPSYGRARAALTDLTDLDTDGWRDLCRAAGLNPGRTNARRRNAAAWVWSDLTGGDLRWSPAFGHSRSLGARQDSLVEDFRRFQLWLTDDLTQALRAHGRALIETINSKESS